MTALGLRLSSENCSLAYLRAAWPIADEAGFDHLWGFDQLKPIFTDPASDA